MENIKSLQKTLENRFASDRQKAQWLYERLLVDFGLPMWHTPLPAIDELVSTILSQNTNDHNRDVAFERLRRRFPSWEAVCDAKVEDIVDAIRPAGLGNQKGERIQAVMHQIRQEHQKLNLDFLVGWEPEKIREYLLQFKGVGSKTAAIVMQFSLGIPAFPVDTHIYRVTGRFGIRPLNMNVDNCHRYMEKLFKPEQYKTGHLNIIRLGREVCQARKPHCDQCPLTECCYYFSEQHTG
ncbi:MAG: endonuclease III domain-containing protein [Anaerolineaceae bacterium]